MTANINDTKKPAFIAYDALWANETQHESLGVGFSHKDGKGYDLLLDGIPLTGKFSLRTPGSSPAAVTPPTGAIPAKRPDYKAFLVSDRKDREGKARWRFIGFGYRQADGEGVDVIYRTIPANNRIVLRLNDDQ